MSGTRFCPNIQDATSAMEFSTPEMEATVSGPVCDAYWTAVSPLSRRPNMWDFALSAMRVNHATVVLLSDRTTYFEIFISTSLCRTNYCKRTAAISKPDFIRKPCGLCSETNSLAIALSNSTLQTKEFNCLVPLNHNPPDHVAQASQSP